MKTGLRMFGRYVPAELVRQLVQTGEVACLGGKKKELTFFFSDIAGFTPISESISPESLMAHISEYLDELTNIIMAARGTIDKYIGDSIMAFWGAPIWDPDHAVRACNAALACQKRLTELNKKWEAEGKAALPTRIGIHTGEAIVGNVGSPDRMNYTVLGDNVNLASRLEGANKIYATRIIISESVYECVSELFLCRPLDLIAVRGKGEGIKIYELVEKKGDDVSTRTAALYQAFARALDKYERRDWDGALEIFSDIHREFPSDQPTLLYIERCKRFQQNPPEPGWTGVTHLNSK
jgi:adenylate cyclase